MLTSVIRSFFGQLFSERWKNQVGPDGKNYDESDVVCLHFADVCAGTIFIDRDGKLFRHIANYLRDGFLDAELRSYNIVPHSRNFLQLNLHYSQ
jgi:hypothetical protein